MVSVFSYQVMKWNPRNYMGCHGMLALETSQEHMWCLELECALGWS